MASKTIKGPCLISYGSSKMWSTDGVEVTLDSKTFTIPTDAHGTVDERFMDASYTISFTPLGLFNGDPMSLVESLVNATPGTPLFGASATALTIKPLLPGQKGLTFPRVGLSKLPSLTLSAGKPCWGGLTFTAIRNGDPGTANNLVQELSYSSISDTPNAANIITAPYDLKWQPPGGDVVDDPWVDLETLNGITFDFNLTLDEDINDNCGITGMTIVDTSVVCKFSPLGLTEQQIITALNTNTIDTVRGMSLRRSAERTLHILDKAGRYQFVMDSAALIKGRQAWGAKKNRIGEVEFHALRRFDTGVQVPLFAFTDLD